MTITKDGNNYSIPSSYKTVEDDFITISMGYKAKEIFDKSEIATLIVVLTTILYGENIYNQIREDVIEKCEKSVLSAWRKCIKEYPLPDRTPFTNMVNEIMDSFEQLKGAEE